MVARADAAAAVKARDGGAGACTVPSRVTGRERAMSRLNEPTHINLK